ncbi:DUF4192 domain-containing protein [Actinoplanes sp. ATCC 53533]|uniref:DUF4192 domain-containing protein n=1 Tax=Actinoplanes sp. ATCC 53533 TaxID=1288362 RepID=UPI0013154638|nr:DUF4192 domain-containing protein [Actinoplanes sp. ATCC 53533]
MPYLVPASVFDSPQETIGAVPFWVGYHPDTELVAIYLDDELLVKHVAVLNLLDSAAALAGQLGLHLPTDAASVVLIGYGPPAAANTLVDIAHVLELMLRVHGLMLVTDGHCVCLQPDCDCPARGAGIAVEANSTQSAAHLAMGGLVALPSKAALHTLVAPDRAAQIRIQDAVTALPPHFTPEQGHIEFSLAQARNGRRLTDEQAAQFAMALTDHSLLSAVWAITCRCMWQRDLWLDLTRRLPDRYVAGPASLAAWCAWRRGEHALARYALDRAQRGPGTGLTPLIKNLLDAHLPAHRLNWPISI